MLARCQRTSSHLALLHSKGSNLTKERPMLRHLRSHAAQAVLIPALLFATSPVGARAMTRSSRTNSAVHRAHANTDYPAPAGYAAWKFSDPECPDNPDSYEWYIEYWNEDNSFNYDVD